MGNATRDASREASWRAVLKRQASSGLSIRAFCRREKLGESNFYAWRRTIAQRDQGQTPIVRRDRAAAPSGRRNGKTGRATPRPTFVPVTVNGGSEHEAGVVLELGGGRRLRFAESIGPERLADFVRALEAEAVS